VQQGLAEILQFISVLVMIPNQIAYFGFSEIDARASSCRTGPAVYKANAGSRIILE